MSKVNNGDMPAMPQSGIEDSEGRFNDSSDWGGSGLTKREQFAAMAMQGLKTGDYHTFSDMASDAVMIADALLAQLEEKGDE
jgi:hypothetical protein